MSNNIQFHIKILSPIHIGCDEVYEPLGFVVDETRNLIYTFDPISFVRSLSKEDKEKFSAICAKGTISSILEIYKFMRGRKVPGRVVPVSSGFVAHYQEVLRLDGKPQHIDQNKIQKELNQFSVSRTAYHPYTGLPYIPGSSLKGALRTAWLNERARQLKIPKDNYKANDLEKLLLDMLDGGKFDSDPFRMLKVSDFMPVGKINTKILYAINEKKKLSNYAARGPFQILEVIERNSIFEGTISVENPPSKNIISSPLRADTLVNAANSFYLSELKREKRELSVIKIIHELDADISEGAFLLRLGRHSGAECVTIKNHRKIKIMQGKSEPPKELDHATTFWLASEEKKPKHRNLKPFGWVLVIPGPAPKIDGLIDQPQAEVKTATFSQAKAHYPAKSSKDKLLEELSLIKSTDKGRLGTIIQKIEQLNDIKDKAAVALAIREKLGAKEFKTLKSRQYLEKLIDEAKAKGEGI